ncbi:hypothetical protein FO440_04810 [Mucilaginibacter corticis]|uniref:Uncharacterized protein n=1 Tax=Mucilaginibacter corticis TaxID=2597670 RepID=A0A556MUE6_9SPHI|nr:hypothetical protein [Mucilaginibacter corticis]TSJ43513.1 hypothetical protein FO440_04810 [Mucilaginibacter corticis]
MFLTDDNKKSFKAIILLNEMINGSHKFQTVGNGDDSVLEPLFIELMSKGYVQTSGMYYQPTAKGQDVFDVFMKRYTEYLKVYDIYSYVDLEKGEFAFARFFDFDTDEAWFDFAGAERFDDLRIAVALFKKVDPAEIVFMSFINENRFDTTSNGWQMDLISDNGWDEIEEICRTAIKPDEVGEDAMVDMISQGSDLMIKLLEEERQQQQNDANYNNNSGEIIEEETVEYYQPYYDPYYVSPIWLLPLFLW